jgi:transposase
MRQSRTLDLGLNGPNDAMAVASVAQEHGAEVISLGAIGTRPCDRAPLLRKRPSQAPHLLLIEEAGPCGSGRYRDVTNTGDDGWVGAPSRGPPTAGDRVHTDRRDARPWARLARSGDRTVVAVPPVADDAIRDLTRARAAPRRPLQAATWRRQAC